MWNQIVDSTATLGKLQNSFSLNKENKNTWCVDDLREENNFLRKERVTLYLRLKEFEENELINNNNNNNFEINKDSLNIEIGLDKGYYFEDDKLADDNDSNSDEDDNNESKLLNKSYKIQIQQTKENEKEIENNFNKELILKLKSELQDQIKNRNEIDIEIDNLKIEILQMLPLRFKINELKQKLDNSIQSLLTIKNEKELLTFEKQKLYNKNNELIKTHEKEINNWQNDFKQLQDDSNIIEIENKGK
jgi:hypothetical protein